MRHVPGVISEAIWEVLKYADMIRAPSNKVDGAVISLLEDDS